MNDTRRPRGASGRPPLPGLRPRMRLEPWPTDPTVGHLVLLEYQSVPTVAEIDEMVERARRQGHVSVRTSALFPSATDVVLEAGFEPLDSLALLRADLLDDAPDRTGHDQTGHDQSGTGAHRVRRLWATQHARAAGVDQLAFGPTWGYDARSLAATRRATPAHRARRVGRIDGYAISGAGGSTGYVQRLAVRPDRQRQGIADTLVADALAWMRSRRIDSVLVNTGVDNVAALRLYERHGFRELPDRLTVAEHVLDGSRR
ncbi:MAG: GNAT family N-acetyltransferase [Ilumatobacteraceae bacterium]